MAEINEDEGLAFNSLPVDNEACTVRKSIKSESECDLKETEPFDEKLCEEIDKKLSLISVLDTVLTAAAFTDESESNGNLPAYEGNEALVKSDDKQLEDEANIEVKMCLEELVDKCVDFYDSIYNEMPNISLKQFSKSNTIYANDSFKLTLGSMNLPKV